MSAISPSHQRSRSVNRLRALSSIVVVLIACICGVGCNQLRLPAIDSTGAGLFAPKPYTTTLAVPGFGSDSCGIKSHFKNHFAGLGFGDGDCKFPSPVFKEPDAPLPCPPEENALAAAPTTLVATDLADASCQDGPPAVLYGDQCIHQGCRLPSRGNRGCILLTPSKIVAPVGGEVVLLSGICGTDGYLQMNEKLEWMLTPDSVGTFIEVGDDSPGMLTKLVGSKDRPGKEDPSYAIGMTSTKRMLITRGNHDTRDDVQLEKGQTWITLSSPSEGTSHVTVLAPESECWDQRKATATIYWVDARWQFPNAQLVKEGQAVVLSTRVTRSEGGLPARGWTVRYEVLQPELASFAGTDDATVTEVEVDSSGNAAVQLVPKSGTSGVAPVSIQIIRPGGMSDNIPSVTLGRGQTFVTWSAPQLKLRAGAPPIATFDSPFQAIANLANPGDQPARNVRVDVQLPPGTRVVGSDAFARVLPNAVTWDIGTLPAQQQLDLFVDVVAQSPVDLVFQARGDGLVTEEKLRIDVFRPALSVRVQPVQQRVESGQPVKFDIDVINTGDRPLRNVQLLASGDSGVIHRSGNAAVTNTKANGPLQPGETWAAQVEFIPVQAGQRCLNVQASADGGQRVAQESCVTVINPVPRAPDLSIKLEGPRERVMGQDALIRATLVNQGNVVASQVRVVMSFPDQLQLKQATQGADQSLLQQRQVAWNLLRVDPGKEVVFEGQFEAAFPVNQAEVTLQVLTDTGAVSEDSLAVTILPQSGGGTRPSGGNLNGSGTEASGSSADLAVPLQGDPTASVNDPAEPNDPVLPVEQASRSGDLKVSLLGRDNPASVESLIRYQLRIVNDSNERDGDLAIEFKLPSGVRLERVSRSTNPDVGEFQIGPGAVAIARVPSIEPGEKIDYELVMVSNQPQTFELKVEVRSVRVRQGVVKTVETTVVP